MGKRIYGELINFKSLTRAPVNELGVVYLFGVLHEMFDLQIESIQAGYPDCIARRKIGNNRWEEVRIEFEYKSKTFLRHKHDPKKIDIIVCWEHDWPECPENIEVIELSSLIPEADEFVANSRKNRKLSEWQKFSREYRLKGFSFSEIGLLWRAKKDLESKKQKKL